MLRTETNPSAQRALEDANRELVKLNDQLTTIRTAARKSANRLDEATEECDQLLKQPVNFNSNSERLERAKARLRVEKAASAAQADRLSVAHKEVQRLELLLRIEALRSSIESARGRT